MTDEVHFIEVIDLLKVEKCVTKDLFNKQCLNLFYFQEEYLFDTSKGTPNWHTESFSHIWQSNQTL